MRATLQISASIGLIICLGCASSKPNDQTWQSSKYTPDEKLSLIAHLTSPGQSPEEVFSALGPGGTWHHYQCARVSYPSLKTLGRYDSLVLRYPIGRKGMCIDLTFEEDGSGKYRYVEANIVWVTEVPLEKLR